MSQTCLSSLSWLSCLIFDFFSSSLLFPSFKKSDCFGFGYLSSNSITVTASILHFSTLGFTVLASVHFKLSWLSTICEGVPSCCHYYVIIPRVATYQVVRFQSTCQSFLAFLRLEPSKSGICPMDLQAWYSFNGSRLKLSRIANL